MTVIDFRFPPFSTTRLNAVLASCFFLSFGLAPAVANASPEEIQVYLDDKEDSGHVSVDLHNNDVLV